MALIRMQQLEKTQIIDINEGVSFNEKSTLTVKEDRHGREESRGITMILHPIQKMNVPEGRNAG